MDARKKKEMLRKFGQRLGELRAKKGLSLRELAARCDVDSSDIQKYESGLVNPTIVTVADLASGLGIAVKELMDFEF